MCVCIKESNVAFCASVMGSSFGVEVVDVVVAVAVVGVGVGVTGTKVVCGVVVDELVVVGIFVSVAKFSLTDSLIESFNERELVSKFGNPLSVICMESIAVMFVHLAWLFHSFHTIEDWLVLKICISKFISCLIKLS